MRWTAILLALLAACGEGSPPAGEEFRLPESTLGQPESAVPALVVRLAADGLLLVDGSAHDLAQVGDLVAATERAVRIEAAAAASVLHLDMLLGEILARERPWGAAIPEVFVAVRDGVLPVATEWPWETFDPAQERATVPFEVIDYGPSGLAVSVRVEGDGTPTMAGAGLASRARAAREATLAELDMNPAAAVSLDSRLSVQGWVDLWESLVTAGFDPVLWPCSRPHPWTREQAPLPMPAVPQRMTAGPWIVRDLLQRDRSFVNLPLSGEAVPDRDDDPDDRVIVNLNARGEILWRGGPVGLDELKWLLVNQAKVYNAKMAAEGRTGQERLDGAVTATTLFALLRADREAPWMHVAWVMLILAEARYSKLQFAARQVADLRETPSEAAALGVEWRSTLPPRWNGQSKLPVFLPTDLTTWKEAESEKTLRLSLDRDSEGNPRYSGVDWSAGDRVTLDARLAAIPRPETVAIRVAPEIGLQAVITLIDAVKRTGCDRFRFLQGQQPSPDDRRAARLPAPPGG